MTTVLACAGGVQAERLVGQELAASAAATQASLRRTLRNPGPATSGGPAIGARSTAVASSAARSRGLRPSALASAMQPLA